MSIYPTIINVLHPKTFNFRKTVITETQKRNSTPLEILLKVLELEIGFGGKTGQTNRSIYSISKECGISKTLCVELISNLCTKGILKRTEDCLVFTEKYYGMPDNIYEGW